MSVRRIDHFEGTEAVLEDGSRRDCEVQVDTFPLWQGRSRPVPQLVPLLRDGEEFYPTINGGGVIVSVRE